MLENTFSRARSSSGQSTGLRSRRSPAETRIAAGRRLYLQLTRILGLRPSAARRIIREDQERSRVIRALAASAVRS